MERLTVSKLLGWTTVIAGIAYGAWRYWQASNQPTADAWAAATDRID